MSEVDLDDLSSSRQLLLKRSVSSDVKEKLIEATTNQWEDWLEFSLFQAEQLGLDYHEEQEVRDEEEREAAIFNNCPSTPPPKHNRPPINSTNSTHPHPTQLHLNQSDA